MQAALASSSRKNPPPENNGGFSAGEGENNAAHGRGKPCRRPARDSEREFTMSTINFKASALSIETLQLAAPSVFARAAAPGLSPRYTFVPTSEIVVGLQEANWAPVQVEEQRPRKVERLGFQKHLIRFRQVEQMQTLDEWNVELVLLNSHDAGCAYQLHAGIYRRICSNGLVVSEAGFEALRFRHSGLDPVEVVRASLRVIEFMPQVSRRIQDFRMRSMSSGEQLAFARAALAVRFEEDAPVDPGSLLQAQRAEDSSSDLWTILNRVQEHLIRGGASDGRRDRNGRLRTVRALRGIDSKVTLNKALWGLAEQVIQGSEPTPTVSLSV